LRNLVQKLWVSVSASDLRPQRCNLCIHKRYFLRCKFSLGLCNLQDFAFDFLEPTNVSAKFICESSLNRCNRVIKFYRRIGWENLWNLNVVDVVSLLLKSLGYRLHLVAGINKLFGTNYTLPNEAVQHYLTQIGVAKPDTAAERITEAVTGGAVSGIGFNALAREVAKRAAAGGLAQRAAQAMTTSTAESATAGAAAGLGGQLVQEAGGGPLAQFAGSLAGGFAGGAPFRGARPPSGSNL